MSKLITPKLRTRCKAYVRASGDPGRYRRCRRRVSQTRDKGRSEILCRLCPQHAERLATRLGIAAEYTLELMRQNEIEWYSPATEAE